MRVCALVLAAGLGRRMFSQRSKVLHKIAEKPLISFVLDAVCKTDIDQIFVITGHEAFAVSKEVGARGQCLMQKNLWGTGDAVKQLRSHLVSQKEIFSHVLIVCGDVPFVSSQTMNDLLNKMLTEHLQGSLLVGILSNPYGYGRVIEDSQGCVQRIIEEKNATFEQKKIKKVNAGAYGFEIQSLFSILDDIELDEEYQEYHLTRVPELFCKKGWSIKSLICKDPWEMRGVNSQKDLLELDSFFRKKTGRMD